MTFLILCPLLVELEGLAAVFRSKGFAGQEEKAGPLSILYFPQLNLRLSLAGHGKTQFGIQTQFLLDRFQDTKAVICAGCAGALTESVAIHDVVVAETTIEHDFKLRFIKKPIPEFPGDPQLLECLRQIRPVSGKIHFGPVASGDEDVIDSARACEIFVATKALAVAWEGAGGARACKFNRMPFVEIRGITDDASHTAAVDFARNLKVAMENVATLIMQLRDPSQHGQQT